MNWDDFKHSDPELAALGEERFDETGLVMIGTIRKNGWPRISAVEPLIFGGKLYLGMMWQSLKALDLLRDPRCTVHSTVSDRHATDGEFKLYGRAVDVTDSDERSRYIVAMSEKIDLNLEESTGSEYHLFSIDIDTASFAVVQGEEWARKLWKASDHQS